jgi:RNA polymerase sigma-70 factor (ECF subfamily)
MRRPGTYQLQAAIAALHDEAQDATATDWPQIAQLYGELHRLQPTPVVALNRAVAVAMAGAPSDGLRLLDEVEADGSLDKYHLLYAARADLLRRDRRFADAAAAYRRTLELCTNDVERRYLERRLREVSSVE